MMKRLAVLFFSMAVGLANLTAQTTTSTTTDPNPTGDTGALKPQIQTGGSYDAHSGNATRIVNDLKVPGALGVYGLDFTRYWNSLQFNWDGATGATPDAFAWSGWYHSWRWVATFEEVPPEPVRGTDYEGNQYVTAISITFPDGHTTRYKIVRLGHTEWLAEGSAVWGPPYSAAELQEFAKGGEGVHDHICNMDPNTGSEFYLCLADGGSVHFVNFVATEVFDPHGLRTGLYYNADGNLEYIEQDGGRFIKLTWEYFSGGGSVITKVEGGAGPNRTGINQAVTYEYVHADGTPQNSGSTSALVLQNVVYENEMDSGPEAIRGHVAAHYHYGGCWGDEPASGVCTGSDSAPLPLLKRADDPHFAGPMAVIRYNYRGEACPTLYQAPEHHPNYIHAQPYAIAAEKSDTGAIVSSFTMGCDDGLRAESNGLGGWRMFYFGTSAETAETGSRGCRGYQLGKLTDFTTDGSVPPNAPSEKQNFNAGHPWHIWDGRGIRTEAILAAGDDSGEPAEIRRVGAQPGEPGSVDYYDRVNPGASAAIDPAQGMHNPYNHWVFSETHQINATTSHTTTYRRDSRRRVTRIDYPGGSAEEFSYNAFNQVTSHTLPSGAVIAYTYDSRGLLKSESNSIDGAGAQKDYTYYVPGELGGAADLVKTVSDGRSRAAEKDFSTRMTYNGRHQVLTVEYAGTIAGPNPTVRYEYSRQGHCTAITDEMDHRSTYTYDDYGRCTSYTEPLNAPDAWDNNIPSRRWDWYYDRVIVKPDGTWTYYDDGTRHTKNEWRIQKGPAFNYLSDRPVIARDHDAENRVVREVTGWAIRPNGEWYWTHGELVYYTYDENGQKKSYKDQLGRITTYDYDLRNRLWKTNETVNTVPRTTETLYDLAGNKTRVNFPVEAAGQRFQQWLDYDAFGQPGRFIDERNNTTNLAYKPWGPMKKLASVTTHRDKDGGGTEDQPTTFHYDGMGRPQWTIFPDGSSELTTYLFGQVDAFKNRKGQTKRLHYDARGREAYHTWDGDAAPRIDRTWDGASRLASIWNSVATIIYTYDDAGQVLSESESITGAGGPAVTGYRRYGNGTIWNLIYPNGMRSARAYSSQLRLETVWDHGPANWQGTINYTYTDDGKVDHAYYGNGTATAYTYDGRSMINSVQHTRGDGANLSARTYYRDERDRITAYQKSTNNSVNPMEDGRGNHYQYDAEGQLTDAWYNAVDPAGSYGSCLRQDHFDYDQLGNRQHWNYVQTHGWQEFSRKDNGLNQYRMWSPFSMTNYDDDIGMPWGTPQQANGVLMQDGNITAGYNALNQMVMVTNGTLAPNWMFFGYDPLGRRVQQWVGQLNPNPGDPPNYVPPIGNSPATFFYYDGWNLIQEGSSSTDAQRQYVHGARVDEIAAQITPPDNAIRYSHYDASGHCTLLTDSGGGIAEQYEYDAFGYPYFFNASGTNTGYSPFGNRFLFTGREWLSDLKLYDYRNRMYQPELGRFMQPDPKEFAAGDYNLYRYCHNDPVNKNDPTGLMQDGYTTLQEIQALHDDPQTPAAIIAVGLSVMAGPVALEGAGAGLLAIASRVPVIARVAAPAVTLGNKLSYMLGEARGNPHTEQRTAQMAAQLGRIGLHNNGATRAYLTRALTSAANEKVVKVLENGNVVRTSVLTGPNGVVKMETIWSGKDLKSVNLFGKGQ